MKSPIHKANKPCSQTHEPKNNNHQTRLTTKQNLPLNKTQRLTTKKHYLEEALLQVLDLLTNNIQQTTNRLLDYLHTASFPLHFKTSTSTMDSIIKQATTKEAIPKKHNCKVITTIYATTRTTMKMGEEARDFKSNQLPPERVKRRQGKRLKMGKSEGKRSTKEKRQECSSFYS